MKSYCIFDGYIIRNDRIPHDDRDFKDEYQNEVYLTALNLCKSNNYTNIVDIGCGSGYKLKKYFDEYNTIGYEIEPCYSYLKLRYPNNIWKIHNFDEKLIDTDIIICSDVIEHIEDPDLLLDWISTSTFKYIVFSTPDRSLLYSNSHIGPPRNTDHVREWNFHEFENYIKSKFNIISHFNCDDLKSCQVCICTKAI
jgi:hypothetical protein